MSATSPLGIIAGNGDLPVHLMQSCSNRQVFILGFDGVTDMQLFARTPHASVRLGAVGEALAHLRNAGVKDIVLAGGMKRPHIAALRPDAAGAKLLARLGAKLFSGGDDALLKAVILFLEEEGFRVLGVEAVAGGLLAPEGVLGKIHPDEKDKTDIAIGIEAARKLGRRDAGQAVIAADGKIIGEENKKGTAELIARCRGGVLVKMKKPGQETRVDLPAIGVDTVRQAHAGGLKGIAVEAGASLILDREKTIAAADERGLFIAGVKA